MCKTVVYGLVDPRTMLVRYVGKSSTGLQRPRQHRTPSALRERNYKARWVESLLDAGLDYTKTRDTSKFTYSAQTRAKLSAAARRRWAKES